MSQARLNEALAPNRQTTTASLTTSTASTTSHLTVKPGQIFALTYGTWAGNGLWEWAPSSTATYWHTIATFVSGSDRAQALDIGAGGVVRANISTYTSGTLQWSVYQGF